MNIKFVTITVKSLAESIKFYENVLNLKVVRKFTPVNGTNIAFLKGDESAMLELIEYTNKSTVDEIYNESKVSIGFTVLDLNETIKELELKEVEIIRGPIKTPGGEKFIFIKDPNGVEIELIEGFDIN